MKIVLASQSPRRQELLRQAGYDLVIKPANFDEKSGTAKQAAEVVLFNACGKCREIAALCGDADPVLGADTIVVIDDVILGKPKDAADAKRMLMELSGRKHQVMTGIAVAYNGKFVSKVAVTDVYFSELTEQEIKDYVATGKPLDKAGAYGIQDGHVVHHIEGNYDNVMGLDMAMVHALLQEVGLEK